MIAGPALIVISRCLDGHPSGAKAVLVLGIIYTVVSVIGTICKVVAEANE
jgi:hypothetical protein